ncbi:MAG: allantoinase AllB [Streptosporangiaceae bacterium]
MTAGPELIVRARRVVTPDGIIAADVAISGGLITAVTRLDDEAGAGGPADQLELAADEVLLPGLVDTHVHVTEPGRTDWEGFATATLAAAAGGVTTIIDMPLNSIPPTVDAGRLEVKRESARGQCSVDTGFWGGAVPGNAADLAGLDEAGVFGFKAFMTDSGVPEFPPLDDDGLAAAMLQVAELDSLLVVHAEDESRLGRAAARPGRGYAGFLRSRPAAAEIAAVIRVIRLATATRARAHVLHLSSADPVPLLAAAQTYGLPVSAETCPHYLTLAAEQIGDGRTEFKCCPPIRELANRERLWAALASGVISCVVSDHSPCPPGLKCQSTGDFGAAWGGISSVQLGLPVTWTHARERGFALTDVARWMSANPAGLAGLSGKGAIAAGYDADLVAFAPDERFTVDPGQLLTRHTLTPYAGQELSGVVRRTWLRGTEIWPGRPAVPAGRLLSARNGGRT